MTLNDYLDEGWDGEGWKPSELLDIGGCILATLPNRRGTDFHPDRKQKAAEFREGMIAEARRRYRAGFYADPFTKDPKSRAA